MDELINKLPNKPGVYFFKTKNGEMLYIGKANNIQKRIKSHLKLSSNIFLRDETLTKDTIDIDYETTNSEIEALLLEAKLIRKFMPKYNVRQKDDSSYPYIVITNEKYPRIQFKRRYKGKKTDGTYYGPFTSANAVRETINFILHAWKIASCRNRKLPKRKCLKSQIDLCCAPCEEEKISVDSYMERIKEVKQFLEGQNKKEIIEEKLKKMKKLSNELRYEEAAKIRDQIAALNRTIENFQIHIPQYTVKSSLKNIKDSLKLSKIPKVIEAFDISNIKSQATVGSMVQFVDGQPSKNNYRRFKIKTVEHQNDVAMMREVIRRRYSRILRENKEFPDLILIDGGKTQLNGTVEELEELDINIEDINIMALAKKYDNIYLPNKKPIKLPKSSSALLFLKRVRDEAHRFAISYHRLLRSKRIRK
ncbi:MAG: excinuclease ABC subunit UvrC [Candidatus Lokiarchaeota archaeon]|nr:excinuclease ABC subunit UvrC [Candidatus Lokiarchaeota archaeon]